MCEYFDRFLGCARRWCLHISYWVILWRFSLIHQVFEPKPVACSFPCLVTAHLWRHLHSTPALSCRKSGKCLISSDRDSFTFTIVKPFPCAFKHSIEFLTIRFYFCVFISDCYIEWKPACDCSFSFSCAQMINCWMREGKKVKTFTWKFRVKAF